MRYESEEKKRVKSSQMYTALRALAPVCIVTIYVSRRGANESINQGDLKK